ncbi:hypothetical protein GGI35DRAFT_471336 [Trichoderma velutinum]
MECIRLLHQSFVNSVRLPFRASKWESLDITPTRCAILELPNELLMAILSNLPQYSQMIISQTCRRLEAVAHQYLPAEKYRPDTFEGRLLYLSHRARSLPDRWVCIECFKFHRVNVLDTPTHSLHTLCDLNCRNGPEYYGQYGFRLIERHLQLTLKYKSYLKSLIAPYHTYLRPNDLDMNKVKRKYSVHPKIVNGRYLLHTVWRYHKANSPMSIQSMGYISICPHQQGHTPTGILPGFNTDIMSPNTQAGLNRMVINNPRDGLYVCIERAFRLLHTEVCSSCTYCTTDFSVQASQKEVVVSVWQDFGVEGTAFSREWSTMVFRLRGVYYHPGRVRKLYGQ